MLASGFSGRIVQSSVSKPIPRKARRTWWVLASAAGALLAFGFFALVLVVRECGKEQFSATLAQLLSKRLDADVTLAPMRSHSLMFLECPQLRIRDRRGHWTFQAQQVSLEFEPSRILAGGLAFRSIMIREGEVWLGVNPEPAKEVGGEAPRGPVQPVAVLPWWLEGRFQDLSRVPIENFQIDSLKIQAPGLALETAGIGIDTTVSGTFHDGKLDWRFGKGAVRLPTREAWSLNEMFGSWDKDRLWVEKGALASHSGAGVTCRSLESQAPGDLTLEVEARQLPLPGADGEVEEVMGPLSTTQASARGVLRIQFPEIQRYHFSGDVELGGLKLGESRIFRLLAGQSGEDRLRHPEASRIRGRIECAPGVVRLTRLACMEEGLFRMEGWLSIVSSEMLGVFDLALPAPLVGKMPGGKPKGFSFPASGWSWARLRVEGKSDHCEEDLSQRLMAQISRDIAVKAGPSLLVAGAPVSEEQRRDGQVAANRQREQQMEKLFYSLIGD